MSYQLWRETGGLQRVVQAWRIPTHEPGESVSDYLRESVALAQWCGGQMREGEEETVLLVPWQELPAKPGWWIVRADGEWQVWLNHAFQMNHRQATGLIERPRLDERAEVPPAPRAWWQRVMDFLRRRRKKEDDGL